MLKYLVVLAILLAFMPTYLPIQGQDLEASTQIFGHAKQKGENERQTSQLASAINRQERPPTNQQHSPGVANQDQQQQVSIVSLPNISFAKEKKSFWRYVFDWGPWIFNLLLVIVGGFQVWLLLRTWRTIGRQADIQAAGMRQWVDVQVTTTECKQTFVLGGTNFTGPVLLWFRASNPTSYPLTIQEIFVEISRRRTDGPKWESYSRKEEIILSPGRDREIAIIGQKSIFDHHFYVVLEIDDLMTEEYKAHKFVVSVNGNLTFLPVIGPVEQQAFSYLTTCGPNNVRVLPLGAELKKGEESEIEPSAQKQT
jgi:hypothetical protein